MVPAPRLHGPAIPIRETTPPILTVSLPEVEMITAAKRP
jgi:hypothetical protein